jgi:Novel STAND NTPase 1
MIEEGKRVCPTCGTSLLVSVLSCPVCALRSALVENYSTVAESFSGSGNRFEHYEIVIGEDQRPVELGRGAMGVTYKATDTNLHCPVALKVINNRCLGDESVRQRFLTEARAAAGLRHPNVASVFHLGTVQGDYFYAMKEALSRVAGDEKRRLDLLQQPIARLAIGLDQLEEIFTLSERFSPDSRASFFKAIRALVESGYGWVVAALRSDFFSRCEEIDALVELKQGNGQYHLLAPKAAQLRQMIRYPAEAAGVVFEEHPEKGPLAERIRDDALKEPGGLPLLEYALDELFRTGSADGVLSHADYEALGGVEGALRKRAEDAFARLEPSEQAALGPVLHQVARLGSGDDETLTRRVASYEAAAAQPGASGLVDAFIAARLLFADRDSAGNRTLTVAHEAWFRVWPEISRWEKENRDFLRVRVRLGETLARWIECNRQSDYLLAPGRPLAEAEDLLKNYGTSMDPEEKNYILASRATVARGVRRRRLIVTGVIAVLAVVAGAAIWEWRAALQSESRAVSARGSAEGILNYLLNQLSDKLKPIGHLDIVEDVQKQVETSYKNLGFSQEDPNALNNWATLVRAEGDRLRPTVISMLLNQSTSKPSTWQRNW